jgi:hypothetical protein
MNIKSRTGLDFLPFGGQRRWASLAVGLLDENAEQEN